MTHRNQTIRVGILMLSLLLTNVFGAACQSGSPSIVIDNPHAILSPIIVGSCSVFLNIGNRGQGSDTLTSARVHIPGTVAELHIMEDGKMKKVDSIVIPPEGTVRLRPAGPHIMVFKMPQNCKKGDVIMMTLSFEKSGEKSISASIVDKYERDSGEQGDDTSI